MDEALAPASIVLDEHGRYIDADDAALSIYGVTRAQLRSHQLGDFAPRGMGHIHRALFLWLGARDRDFGGGQSTIVSGDGRETRVEVLSVRRVSEGFRIEFRPLLGPAAPPHSPDLGAVLDAWREADREAARSECGPAASLAREVSTFLRGVYQYVFESKTPAAVAGRTSDRSAPSPQA